MSELSKQQVQGGFSEWVKEDRIPPIRRDHHRKTWDRAQQVLLQELRERGVLPEAQHEESQPIGQLDTERIRAGVVSAMWDKFK